MRRLRLALLVFAVLALGSTSLAGDDEPIRAGKVARRLTRGGLEYAIYAPRGWRKRRPVPLAIHVPMERFAPIQAMRTPYVQEEFEAAASRSGFLALHCGVMLEAHNKENAESRPEIDVERYRTLLERDVGVVVEVIEALASEVSIDREAIFLLGSRYAAEAAVGIAARRPDLFAAVLAKETATSALGNQVGARDRPIWFALPEGRALEPALDLAVVFAFDPGEPNGDVRQESADELQHLLRELGFRRVEQVLGVPDDSYRQFVSPEMYAWIAKRVVERRARAEKRAERDGLLTDASRYADKGNLSSALRRYRKAVDLEEAHGLDPASAGLYEVLVAGGRALLEAADGQAESKRRAAYRKVAKLFADTPFGAEVSAALEGMR